MTLIYGIKNCDTMKKALRWLGDHQVSHQFHDYRKDGLDADLLTQWINELGWEGLVNKRGTTWRKLDAVLQDSMNKNALEILLANPAMIKRPLLVHENKITLGFKPELYQDLFSK